MQFKQVLLVFSALITLAYSFPTGAEQNNTTDFSQNVSNVSDVLNKKPLKVIVEDKNPKSESVVVEFVYNSNDANSLSESKSVKGTDKDKYVVDSLTSKEGKDQTKNLKGKEKLDTEETAQGQGKLDSSHMSKNFHMKAATSLMPEEVSPLSEKWPKFFYDIFNPIQPFPELQYKSNQMNAQVQSENADTYLSYYEKERKESMNVAGPPLNPLSVYDREFNVPIFD